MTTKRVELRLPVVTKNTEVDDAAESAAVLRTLLSYDANPPAPYHPLHVVFPAEAEQQAFLKAVGWYAFALDHVPLNLDGYALAERLGLETTAFVGRREYPPWPGDKTLVTKRKPKVAKGAVSRRDDHIKTNASAYYLFAVVFSDPADLEVFRRAVNWPLVSGHTHTVDGLALATKFRVDIAFRKVSLLSQGQNPGIIRKCRTRPLPQTSKGVDS
jgi:hypothetical protein